MIFDTKDFLSDLILSKIQADIVVMDPIFSASTLNVSGKLKDKSCLVNLRFTNNQLIGTNAAISFFLKRT